MFPQNDNWVIPESIHSYTAGGFWEFWGQGGFFELEIQRHGGTYNWNSEGMGGFVEGTDKNVKAQMNW